MRLLIIASGDFHREFGGGQVYVRNLVEALVAAGHNVKVTNGLDDIEREKPDVVHAHGLKEAAARAARRAGVPCVVTIHHGGLVCPQGALLDWQDRICQRPVEQKLCTRCCLGGRWWGYVSPGTGELLEHLPDIPFITPPMKTPLMVIRKREEIANLARDVTMFVAPSVAAQDALLRNGVPRERAAVVPHGIKPLTPGPLAPNLRFAYVGRICHEKGFHVLVEAFRRFRGDAELHVFGEAHSKWDKRYLRRVKLPPRVVLHGHLGGDALASAWAACAVTVVPSICLEVFGLTVQESFSLGRPVIATDCGGPPEQIRNTVDGFVVPPNDPAAFAAAMQRFADGARLNIPRPRTMTEHVADLQQVYTRCVSR
jgi:glycosyltransferase involved in cell wall biosynthesis